jgi:hypothetical protein
MIKVSEAALDSIQRMGEADKARIAELEAAIKTIAELDPEKDSHEGYNEWGEADCFNQAQIIASRVSTNVQTIAKSEN